MIGNLVLGSPTRKSRVLLLDVFVLRVGSWLRRCRGRSGVPTRRRRVVSRRTRIVRFLLKSLIVRLVICCPRRRVMVGLMILLLFIRSWVVAPMVLGMITRGTPRGGRRVLSVGI